VLKRPIRHVFGLLREGTKGQEENAEDGDQDEDGGAVHWEWLSGNSHACGHSESRSIIRVDSSSVFLSNEHEFLIESAAYRGL